MHDHVNQPLAIGTRIAHLDGYEAIIVEVGTIPDTHSRTERRGLPGYRVRWRRLDETGPVPYAEPPEYEPLQDDPTAGWVLREQCTPI